MDPDQQQLGDSRANEFANRLRARDRDATDHNVSGPSQRSCDQCGDAGEFCEGIDEESDDCVYGRDHGACAWLGSLQYHPRAELVATSRRLLHRNSHHHRDHPFRRLGH